VVSEGMVLLVDSAEFCNRRLAARMPA